MISNANHMYKVCMKIFPENFMSDVASQETRWGNTDEPMAPQIISTDENINYATSYTTWFIVV